MALVAIAAFPVLMLFHSIPRKAFLSTVKYSTADAPLVLPYEGCMHQTTPFESIEGMPTPSSPLYPSRGEA